MRSARADAAAQRPCGGALRKENQVENKLRALVNYELARQIPFVK
jgi:hypothetical protein